MTFQFPDAAVVGNIITGAGVVVSAFAGGFVAATFWNQRAEKQLDRAITITDKFFQSPGQDLPSPSDVLREGFPLNRYTSADESHELYQARVKRETETHYAILSSYFDMAWHLYQRDLIDPKYFMWRMSRVILQTARVVKPLEDGELAGRIPSPSFIQLLEPHADEYGRGFGFVRGGD